VDNGTWGLGSHEARGARDQGVREPWGPQGRMPWGPGGRGLGSGGQGAMGDRGRWGPWGQGAWALGPRGQGQGGQGPGEQGSEASPCPAITPKYSVNGTLSGVYENTEEYVYTTQSHGVVYMKTPRITYTPLVGLMGAKFL
jgi:hypothetical protein